MGNGNEEAIGEKPGRQSSRAAIVLSVALLPGTGQWVQGRWLAALLLNLSSLGCLVSFVIHTIPLFVAFYSLWDFEREPPGSVPLAGLVLSAAGFVALYIASLVDVVLAHHRMSRRFSSPPIPPAPPSIPNA